MANQATKTKATYNKDQHLVLLLKESFQRDLTMFSKLLEGIPRDWTLTVIQEGSQKELVVNIPAKKK
jgi:hypothetical protein